ncbi:MAG: DUF2336 domain-containing protein [Alphaproteobacteria bacterium]|nr:DUF2336 domain-containing protein [Alphaproteobacteria bacterium]MBN9558630.1 DUF2336 domain-containing protein [Alphaproteobacteria bacterium]MBN9578177.1 DUF2336 domain-containing protein [Alphaproteobacteria bacterium]MBN9591357.1 DUF2336 domain-containing protein [Alphaproteobacteria bacterium]
MGLTVRDMNDMGRLAQLAANPQDTTREEIYLAVASLYRVQGNHLSPRECALMQDILKMLTRDVEMTIRIALAERLADDISAPHDLILLLADDRVEVARPVILRSALISDDDILQMIAKTDVAYHEVIAQRPNIGVAVTGALSRSETETVLTALAHNTTACFDMQTQERLVEKSRRHVSLQEALAQRRDLPPPLAERMCAWVSGALREHILRNYPVSAATVDTALNEIDTAMHAPSPAPKENPNDGAQKLIDKLAAAGQLKPGFLLRVLHQGQTDLFDLAFARLLGLNLPDTRKALYENGPASVAVACRAVGIDRSVFPTVYNLSRQAHGIPATLSAEQKDAVTSVFSSHSREQALQRLSNP